MLFDGKLAASLVFTYNAEVCIQICPCSLFIVFCYSSEVFFFGGGACIHKVYNLAICVYADSLCAARLYPIIFLGLGNDGVFSAVICCLLLVYITRVAQRQLSACICQYCYLVVIYPSLRRYPTHRLVRSSSAWRRLRSRPRHGSWYVVDLAP